MDIVDLYSLIQRCKSEKRMIYIWGVGAYGIQLGKIFDKEKVVWSGFYDNFTAHTNPEVNGKKVFSGNYINKEAIYILSMKNYKTVFLQLLDNDILEQNIIYFSKNAFFSELDELAAVNTVSSEKIRCLKDYHKDEKCFIIGNGPSLQIEDLDRIKKNEIQSFGCNRIYEAYNMTDWRPSYYFFTDILGIKNSIDNEEILRYLSANCKMVFSRTNGELCSYLDKIENLVLFKSVYSPDETEFQFSNECENHVYIGYTVTYAMLQMAVYMGFREIFLLGIDHNYAVEIKENGEQVHNNVVDHSQLVGGYQSYYYCIDKTTRAFIAAKQYADSHGIKIYNATRGGKLEVFERVNFDDLF